MVGFDRAGEVLAGNGAKVQKLFDAEATQFWGERAGMNDASEAFRPAYLAARIAQLSV